jgi:hypothetical protein
MSGRRSRSPHEGDTRKFGLSLLERILVLALVLIAFSYFLPAEQAFFAHVAAVLEQPAPTVR